MEELAGRALSPKEVDEMWEKIQADKKQDAAIMEKERLSRIRAKNKANPMGKAKGGMIKGYKHGGSVKTGRLAKRGYGAAKK